MEHDRKISACKLLGNGGATRDRTEEFIVANDAVTGLPTERFQQPGSRVRAKCLIFWNVIGTYSRTSIHRKQAACSSPPQEKPSREVHRQKQTMKVRLQRLMPFPVAVSVSKQYYFLKGFDPPSMCR